MTHLYRVSLPLIFLTACTNTIVPPEAPADPEPVFLLDHGRHASLVLSAADSGLIRYAYGDWAYYAERRTGPLESIAAILWPTQAALGRQELPGPATPAGVRSAVRVGIEHLHEILVASADVTRLRARLDTIHAYNRETALYNAAYDLEFVHHPHAYTGIHNSNRVAALWLMALGCRVDGMKLFSRWKVER